MPRVAAVPLGVLIGLPIAACFVKPDPPQALVSDAGKGSGSDGGADASDDARPCSVHDDYQTPQMYGCGSWATQNLMGAIGTSRNGSLVLTSNGSGDAAASCEANTTVDLANGVILQIIQPARGSGASVTLEFETLSQTVGSLVIAGTGSATPPTFSVVGPTSATTPAQYNYSGIHWWRLRAASVAQTFGVDNSTDGMTWIAAGSPHSINGDLTQVTVRFLVKFPITNYAMTVELDNLDACP